MNASRELKSVDVDLINSNRERFYNIIDMLYEEIPNLTSLYNTHKTAEQLQKAIDVFQSFYNDSCYKIYENTTGCVGRYGPNHPRSLKDHVPFGAILHVTLGDLYEELTFKQATVTEKLNILDLSEKHYQEAWSKVANVHRREADELAEHAAFRMHYVNIKKAQYFEEQGKIIDAINCYEKAITALNKKRPYLAPWDHNGRSEITSSIEMHEKEIEMKFQMLVKELPESELPESIKSLTTFKKILKVIPETKFMGFLKEMEHKLPTMIDSPSGLIDLFELKSVPDSFKEHIFKNLADRWIGFIDANSLFNILEVIPSSIRESFLNSVVLEIKSGHQLTKLKTDEKVMKLVSFWEKLAKDEMSIRNFQTGEMIAGKSDRINSLADKAVLLGIFGKSVVPEKEEKNQTKEKSKPVIAHF